MEDLKLPEINTSRNSDQVGASTLDKREGHDEKEKTLKVEKKTSSGTK